MGEDFHLKFVKPRNGELDPRLVEASNMLKEHGLSPEWVEHDHCLSVDSADKNHAYVMEPFEGSAFEHLKLLGCRLFGPQCIMASLNFKMELPQKKRPIYNVCMKGVVISCTSMEKKTRDHIHNLVELMAGEANRNLTDDVTHLVAGEVGSQKYIVAASRHTPIMSLEWVKDTWDMGQHRYVDCTETDFVQKYRCPIFKGLVITVSGLTQEERQKVKQMVQTEGGTYTGEMKMNECTHLILKEPKGQKYDYATKWKIHIVNLTWIYDSLDKNYCQVEKNYPVTGKPGAPTVKTSTPERSRLSAINPSIADISAISATHINETGQAGTRLSDTTLDNVENEDKESSRGSSAHPILTTCRIYVSSGLKGAHKEQCSKLLNATDATRILRMNDGVTHVIMEEEMEAEIIAINDMELKPHVVSVKWLAECVRQSCTVAESDFLSPFLLESDSTMLKIAESKKGGPTTKKRSSDGKSDEGEETLSPAADVPAKTGRGDVDMKHLLSQYIEDDSKEGERTVQAIDEVDGSDSTSRDMQTAGHRDDQHHDDNDEATQDPDSEMPVVEAGVFGGKSFSFFGFSEEDTLSLSEYVTQAGGVCVSSKRRVADYAVVPILGYPVEQTVGQVVTNAWVQMCLEAEELLPVYSNPIFKPVDIDEASRPLQGCVLSFSGYTGTERDCLNHIAEVLGADCQEFFVRKAKKSLKASTHLVVKEPSGSKYTAAKNWDIPALSKDWVFACAQSGEKEDEAMFNIDNVHNSTTASAPPPQGDQQPETEAEGKSSRTESAVTAEKGTVGKGSEVETIPEASTSHHPKQAGDQTRTVEEKEQAQTDRNPGRTLSESTKTTTVKDNIETIATSSASDREQSQGRSQELGNPMGSAKAMVEQQGRLPPSQKENQSDAVNGALPVTPGMSKKKVHSRVEELQQQQQSGQSILSPGADSPSVFLAPGYRPKFDLTGVFEYLKSPEVTKKEPESPSLQEVFEYYLAVAVKNSSVPRNPDPVPSSSQSSQAEDRGPLEGVVIAVSKKLGVNQTEYNTIAVELGGDYTWQYTPSCTHFIFQGRANDLNKEYRQAKSEGKFIVSPHWLYACKEQRLRVEESMYPHNYNPNFNLGGVVTTETPSRGLRHSVRRTPRSAYDRPASRTPAQSTMKPSASEVWQESMNEMKNWQEVGKASAKTPQDAGKARLGSEVEETVPQKCDKTGQSGSTEREVCGETSVSLKSKSSSSSLSSMDEKSGGDKSKDISGQKEEETCQQGKESEAKETSGMVEVGGSLEIREALSRTLKSVKASSSQSKKSSKKRSRRSEANSSGGPMNTSGNLPESATTHHISPWQTQHRVQEAAHTTESLGAEASQSVQITWDDPTERREKERLAHKLEMVCGPSQNTEDFMANMDMPELNDSPVPTNQADKSSTKPPAPQVRSPTPEPPPLAFPTAKVLSKVTSPQPIELLSEESSESQAEPPSKPIILTSGMAPQERIEFAEVIEQLGGTVLEKQQFDPTCTHVVVVKPSRNEKFLAAVATGRWVLHKSYLIACRQEGRFVREEEHEWGNPAMSHLMQSLDSQTFSLVKSAHKWRLKVQAMRKKEGSSPGAYQGWRVILLTDRKREDNFRRLLTAGGATVLNIRPPLTQVEATHCFVEMHKVKLSESDLEALVTGVTHILKPEFIAAHLTDDPPPSPQNFTPAEVDSLRNRMQGEQPRKRKAGAGEEAESSKRPRR